MKRILVACLACAGWLVGTPFWDRHDFERAEAAGRGPAVMQSEVRALRGEWQRWSYVHEFFQTAHFIAGLQVSDSLDPEFGGMIEGEDQLGIVETDNTQEAIWVWCRYYQLTGDTTYFMNVRRAWIYVMNHPAYLEEGVDSDYYRVWNCGLGLFCETMYRAVTGDATYLWYSDSCAGYILRHPLSFAVTDPLYRRLHPKVTGLAAGMLYQYGKVMGVPEFRDSALVYGERVRAWIEQDPGANINDEAWAMSGGTAVWGMCRSIFDADSAYGQSWLAAYLPLMKYYQPTGTWNNSWNIWYAYAYDHAAQITQTGAYIDYHHGLTDSMLVQDYDDDGGVPPTKGWNSNQDHAWVSTYMVFMGFEGLMDSVRDHDAGVVSLLGRGPKPYRLVGDSIRIAAVAANYGFDPLVDVPLSVSGAYLADTVIDLAMGAEDTVWFPAPWIAPDTGTHPLAGIASAPVDERRANDTLAASIYINPLRQVSGTITDSASGAGIAATIRLQFIADTGSVYFDSVDTDPGSGIFTAWLIDSLYRARIQTDVPYPDSIHAGVFVTPDSLAPLDFVLSAADIAIVNRDPLGRYAEYLMAPLDSLGLESKSWAPTLRGTFPFHRLGEFQEDVIIWFTGRAESLTVSPAEQESLANYLDAGGRLLVSGQNIAEELAGGSFLADYLHAALVDDSSASLRCYPDTQDSLGVQLGKLYTVGLSGAQDQYSRDVIAAVGGASVFLYYDSLLNEGAAVWYRDAVAGYQVVYCAFGIEAVHKPPPWAGYIGRRQLLAGILDWMGVTAIAEQVSARPCRSMTIWPSIIRSWVTLSLPRLLGAASAACYDAGGRLVKRIPVGRDEMVTWDLTDSRGRRVPAGVYFIQVSDQGIPLRAKVIILD